MSFKITCINTDCLEYDHIYDGYTNDREFSFKVVGDNTVEVTCKNCGSKHYILDGGI